MIYVTLDLYYSNYFAKKSQSKEVTVVKGPYTEIHHGYQGEIDGTKPDGSTETVFEATVGRGGFCETCAYDYPDFGYNGKIEGHGDAYSWEVKDFKIESRE